MSNFDKVIDFNKTCGVQTLNNPKESVFTKYPKLIDLRMKLIREEMEELEESVKTHDIKETIDALSDILYVVYGMGDALGIDLDHTFNMVHNSNMSKLCNTKKEAEETVQWYKDNSDTYNEKNPAQSPVEPIFTFINGKYVINNKTTGKVLKSIYYSPVDFTQIV